MLVTNSALCFYQLVNAINFSILNSYSRNMDLLWIIHKRNIINIIIGFDFQVFINKIRLNKEFNIIICLHFSYFSIPLNMKLIRLKVKKRIEFWLVSFLEVWIDFCNGLMISLFILTFFFLLLFFLLSFKTYLIFMNIKNIINSKIISFSLSFLFLPISTIK